MKTPTFQIASIIEIIAHEFVYIRDNKFSLSIATN